MKPPRDTPRTGPPAAAARGTQRIAKLLARAGIASRREIERMIADGRVALNGTTLDTPATLLASLHGVTVDGQPVAAPAPARLFRFHKPVGLLTAERDPVGRPTIYDRLPKDLPRVMPVGRLDLATEGLLLLTTDGELKRQLELPSTGVTRSYRARAFGEVSQEQLEELIHGITIEGVRYGSIDANLERRTGRNQWIELRLTEGKNREVRRVLEHLGLQVSRLIRTSYGPFALADLPAGAVDEIRQHDLVEFRRSLSGGARSSPAFAGEGDQPQAGGGAAPQARFLPRSTPRRAGPAPAPPRPAAVERPKTARSARSHPPAHRDATINRPTRPTRAPAAEAAAPAEDKPARLKRGAGWAKPKPKPSSRPTRRGEAARRHPTKDRPGGGRK